MAQIASVAAITGTGKAFAVNEQGVSRELKAGDVLQKGETIHTVGDARVELLMEDGSLLAVAPNQVLRLDENVSESDQRPTAQDSAVGAPAATADTVLQALERGTDLSTELEATAAGLGGGGGADGGSSFVQLLRIVEGVDPLAYEYAYTAPDLLPDLQSDPLVVPEVPAVSIGVTVGTGIGVGGDGSGLITGDIIKGTVSTVDVVEGSGGGTRAVTFLVTLDKVSSTDVTVTYTIVPGSASRPDDFNDGAITGTITIPAGYIGFSLTENIVEDTLVEGNETFTIVLSNPVGATLVNDTATVTIIDDDVSVAAQGGQGDESDGLVTLTGSLAADFGPGDTGTVSLAAVNASWDAGSNTLSAGDGSWKIVVNADGTYTFTQLAAFTHTDATNPDDPLAIQITATATDNMVPANSNTTTFTVTVNDDGPSVTANAVADGEITLTTQDAQTIGDAFDTASASFAAAFLAAAVPVYGADGAGATATVIGNYTLTVDSATSGLLSNGVAITLTKVGNDVVGSAGEAEVFRISVDAAGNVKLTQTAEVDHVEGTSEDAVIVLAGEKVTLSATATTTDGDGDTATVKVSADLGGNIRFDDDTPNVSVSVTDADSIVLNTQDADTVGNLTDTTGAVAFAGAFAAAVSSSFGADGAGNDSWSYALSVTGTPIATQGATFGLVDSNLDSNGASIYLYNVGGTIVGSTDTTAPTSTTAASVVFTLSVNATGEVTMTQAQEIDHAGPGVSSNYDAQEAVLGSGLIGLTGTVVRTDGDGDTATASGTLDLGGNVKFDDAGPAISAQSMVLANQTHNVATASLNLDIGADGFGSVAISGAVNTLGFAVDSSGKVLTSGNIQLTYITDSSGTLYATTNGFVSGAVFSVNPDEATGTYTITMLGTLDAQTAKFNSNFGTTDAGGPGDPYISNFTSVSGVTQRVDIFGFGATQAKPSSDGLGVDSNSVNGQEKVGVFFGTTVDKAFVTVGNFAKDSYDWKAVNITSQAVATIATIPDVDPALPGWSLQEFYDSITITGNSMFGSLDGVAVTSIGTVVDGGTVDALTDTTQSGTQTDTLNPAVPFNFLYVAANTDTDSAGFKITQLSFEGETTASPVNVNFTATATDGDMDTATSAFTATFAGNTNGSFTIISTPGGEVLDGSTGSDTFVWKLNDTGSDMITDFKLGPVASGGDVLDLKDLLVGEHNTTASLDTYLTFSADATTGKTVITVDANAGETGGTGQTITLDNVQFTALQDYAGGARDDAAIITKLLADGHLKTDI